MRKNCFDKLKIWPTLVSAFDNLVLAHLLGNPERGTLLCNLGTLGNAQKPSQESLSGKGTVLKDLISIFFIQTLYNYRKSNIARVLAWEPCWPCTSCLESLRKRLGNHLETMSGKRLLPATPNLHRSCLLWQNAPKAADLERVGYQPREPNWSDLQFSKLQQVCFHVTT